MLCTGISVARGYSLVVGLECRGCPAPGDMNGWARLPARVPLENRSWPWTAVRQFLKRLDIEIPHDRATLLLRVYPRDRSGDLNHLCV